MITSLFSTHRERMLQLLSIVAVEHMPISDLNVVLATESEEIGFMLSIENTSWLPPCCPSDMRHAVGSSLQRGSS